MAEIKGTVKWFDRRKGYGFIRMEDGQEVFVHATGIESGHETTLKYLKAGEAVTCTVLSDIADSGRQKCVGVCIAED